MSFDSIKALSAPELVALAHEFFGDKRFTASTLTVKLCSLFGMPFKHGLTGHVEMLLEVNIELGAVQIWPGPRGGAGYGVAPQASTIIGEIELPQAMFERRVRLDDEKSRPAEENAGLAIEQLRQALPPGLGKVRDYLGKLEEYWLKHRWLSTTQAEKLADTALHFGVYLNRSNLVGAALDEWVEPILERKRRAYAKEREQFLAAAQARRKQLEEEERVRQEALTENRRIGSWLLEEHNAVRLATLDAFVNEVFPGTTLSKSAKTAAFSGRGAQALRVAISAIILGRPPNCLWRTPPNYCQPDEHSDLWRQAFAHPAFSKYALPEGDNCGSINTP